MKYTKNQVPWNKGKKLHYKIWNKGTPCSEETKKKISESRKGKTPWNKGIKYLAILGEKHTQWKGDKVGYHALHAWLSRNKGKADHCENSNCTSRNPKKFEWSNISGEYKRDINDYESLCIRCHRKKDLGSVKPWNYGKKLHYTVWNKGKKTGLIPRSAWKKGETPKGSILFKKGQIPWNKKLS